MKQIEVKKQEARMIDIQSWKGREERKETRKKQRKASHATPSIHLSFASNLENAITTTVTLHEAAVCPAEV